VSSILRSLLLNALLIGLFAGCGGDDDPPSSGSPGGSAGTRDGGSGTSGSGGAGTNGASGTGGTSAGSSGTDGASGSSGSGGTTCADVTCTPPATCDSSVATPRCVCPTGYEDVAGDGSNCRDIDECTAGTDDCHAAATCTNTPGSFTCACNAPAWTGDGKMCACATGYKAVGDQCLKDNAGPCTAGTECATGYCVGGACCELPCNTPGSCQKQEGTQCVNGTTCRYGKLTDGTVCDDGDACTNNKCFDGVCGTDTVNPGKNCSDSNQCTTDTCAPGTGACVNTAINPAVACNDNNPCTNDTCTPAAGCTHTDNNTAACSDNNACTDDRCNAGVCTGTPKVCPVTSADCQTGTCTNGTCGTTAKNVGGACDEGLTACSATGKCSAAGACTGQNDACGPLAASCAPCTSGTNCFQGRLCTCAAPPTGQPPHRIVNGVCVPDTNECNANPCASIATCNDPTPNAPASGDYVCTCPAGYTGNGRGPTGCTDANECTPTNPCVVGTCNNTTPPQRYTCTCPTGYRSITPAGATGPTCVCDLGGTYSVVSDTTFTYPPIFAPDGTTVAIEGSPPGGVTVRGWSVRHHAVAANGAVTVRTIPCGGTAPTVCDRLFGFAHAQYQSNQIWGRAKVNAGFPTVTGSLVGVRPGGQYNEPEVATVQGINLLNPTGPWPPCRQCVGVAAGAQCTCPGQAPFTVTNPATWVDTDEDGFLGMTTEDVSRGGELIDGVHPDPPIAYTQPSECPRTGTPTGTYGYSEWPGLVGISLFRTYRWYAASRGTSSLRGSTITFDTPTNACAITGTLIGPDAGRPKAEARFQGCETCAGVPSNSCSPGNACTGSQVDFYDGVEQTQTVTAANFTMKKLVGVDIAATLALADTNPAKAAQLNQVCDEIREANCPAGKNCTTP
jgi:hypothetical protein